MLSLFRKNLRHFNNISRTFRLIWNSAGYWTIAWCLLILIQGFIPVATVFITRQLVDSLTQVLGKGLTAESIKIILLPVALMAGVMLLSEVLKGASTLINTNQAELVNDHISALVHQKSIDMDLACYESSEYYDHLNRIRGGASNQALSLMGNVGGIAQNSITLLSMAMVLAAYSPWMPLIVVASALPTLLVALRLNREQHQWWVSTTTDRRWLEYQEQLLTHCMSAPEIRVFGLGHFFKSGYQSIRHRLRKEQIQLITRQSLRRLGASFLSFLLIGIAFFWMLKQALLGTVTLGDLALFYQALNKSQGLMRSVLGNLNQLHQNQLFIRDLFQFFDLQLLITEPATPLPIPIDLKQGIDFRNISFRYPGSHRLVLENFNLTIPARKIVAIVGDNGAGKSTLTKLLCRFYDPEVGSVKLDGVDIRNLSLQKLRRLITILFQFPVPYYLTASKSIALGDISIPPKHEEIEAAAKISGVHEAIARLPNGYDSQLGKTFPGGTDLSGGEWQRLALARAFFRKAPIIILDEPTSAMDPWAEADWLERFRQLAKGRTSIIITHRFTLAMKADIIYVMRRGQIVESGNHNELVCHGGIYAQSWNLQMQSGLDEFTGSRI